MYRLYRTLRGPIAWSRDLLQSSLLTAGWSGLSGGDHMTKPRLAFALLTSIAALAFSGTATSTLANGTVQAAHIQEADASLELSAQGRRGGGGFGGGGRHGGFGG